MFIYCLIDQTESATVISSYIFYLKDPNSKHDVLCAIIEFRYHRFSVVNLSLDLIIKEAATSCERHRIST